MGISQRLPFDTVWARLLNLGISTGSQFYSENGFYKYRDFVTRLGALPELAYGVSRMVNLRLGYFWGAERLAKAGLIPGEYRDTCLSTRCARESGTHDLRLPNLDGPSYPYRSPDALDGYWARRHHSDEGSVNDLHVGRNGDRTGFWEILDASGFQIYLYSGKRYPVNTEGTLSGQLRLDEGTNEADGGRVDNSGLDSSDEEEVEDEELDVLFPFDEESDIRKFGATIMAEFLTKVCRQRVWRLKEILGG